MVEADRLSWVFVGMMGGVVQADRITAGPNMGEFPLGGFRDKTVRGQVLWLEPESESWLEPELEAGLESESKPKSKTEGEPESKSESKPEPKPSSDLRDSGAPLVSH